MLIGEPLPRHCLPDRCLAILCSIEDFAYGGNSGQSGGLTYPYGVYRLGVAATGPANDS